MMLRQSDRIDAEAITQLRFREGFADNAPIILWIFYSGKYEVAEFHSHPGITSLSSGSVIAPPELEYISGSLARPARCNS